MTVANMELNIKLQVEGDNEKDQARKLAESLEYMAEHLLTTGMKDFTHKREGIIGTGQFQLTMSHINALERDTIKQIEHITKVLDRTDLDPDTRTQYESLKLSLESSLSAIQGTEDPLRLDTSERSLW